MSKCRICLCNKPRRNLTELKLYENGKERNYKDIIEFCLGIQVTEDINTSTKLCIKCFRNIINFYEFKVLALKNDEQLRSEVENRVFCVEEKDYIKTEKETENTDKYIDEPIVIQTKNEDNSIVNTQSNVDNINEFNYEYMEEHYSDDIKTEKETENTDKYVDEPIVIQIKNEDNSIVNAQSNVDNMNEFKYEYKEEHYSDDEFLSVLKDIKGHIIEETKENSPIQKKKRGKIKQILTPEELRAQKKRNKGIIEGVCEHCGQVYKDLTAHLRLQHRQERVTCEHCNETFKNYIYKKIHVKRKHFNSKQSCPLCKLSVGNLKMHMQNIHNKDSLPFKCVHCEKKFLTQSLLKLHITVHTKDRPYPCEICGGTFRLKHSRDKHIRQVHNKERGFLCQFCSKSFFDNQYLKNHLRSHTKENPYSCPDCDKCYRSRKSLNNHRLVHGAEKKFICATCGVAFLSKRYLTSHMVSHTKEKRYPCQYCTVRFHRSDHRKRHEYTAHLKHTGSVVAVPRSYTPKKRSKITPKTKLLQDVYEESTASTGSSV